MRVTRVLQGEDAVLAPRNGLLTNLGDEQVSRVVGGELAFQINNTIDHDRRIELHRDEHPEPFWTARHLWDTDHSAELVDL
ncbi:hypothetical protein D3C75_792100 [compost metagenome]